MDAILDDISDPGYPANLTPIWDANWGYLHDEDVAPVLLGEFTRTRASPQLVAHTSRVPQGLSRP